MEKLISQAPFSSDKIEKTIQEDRNLILDQIFNDYYDRVYKFYIYRTNNVHIAEELTSIVFEKIVGKIGSYKSSSPLAAWIFTIARNSMYDYFKTDKSRDSSPIEDYVDILESSLDVEAYLDKKESKLGLIDLLARLSPREREILSYKFGAGLQNIEIGKLMKLSPSNVGSIVYRSMKKLRAILEEDKNEI